MPPPPSKRKGFTFPGHAYLGPGNELDGSQPVDRDDEIAKLHDEDYARARTGRDISQADFHRAGEFLEDVYQTGNWHSVVGAVGLYSKYAAEKLFGVQYPSTFRGLRQESGEAGSSSNIPSSERPTDHNSSNDITMAHAGHRKRSNSVGDDDGRQKRIATGSTAGPPLGGEGSAGVIEGSTPSGQTTAAPPLSRQRRMDADSSGADDSGNGQANGGRDGNVGIGDIYSLGTLVPSWVVKNRFIVKSWAFAQSVITAPSTYPTGYNYTTPLMYLPFEYVNMYVSRAEYQQFPDGTIVEHCRARLSLQGSQISFATNSSLTGNATAQHMAYGMVSDDLFWKGYDFGSYTTATTAPMVPTDVNNYANTTWLQRRWGYESGDPGMSDGVPRHCGNYYSMRGPYTEKAISGNKRQLLRDVNVMPLAELMNKDIGVFEHRPKYGFINTLPEYWNYGGYYENGIGYGGPYTEDGIRSGRVSVVNDEYAALTTDTYSLKYTVPTSNQSWATSLIDLPWCSTPYKHMGSYNPEFQRIGVGMQAIPVNAPGSDTTDFVNACAFWAVETEMHCRAMRNSDVTHLFMGNPNDTIMFPNTYGNVGYCPDQTMFSVLGADTTTSTRKKRITTPVQHRAKVIKENFGKDLPREANLDEYTSTDRNFTVEATTADPSPNMLRPSVKRGGVFGRNEK